MVGAKHENRGELVRSANSGITSSDRELRLVIDGEVIRTHGCQSGPEWLDEHKACKTALIEKGWRMSR